MPGWQSVLPPAEPRLISSQMRLDIMIVNETQHCESREP